MRTSPKFTNNFDLLRLVFASSVYFHHAYALTLSPDLRILARWCNVEFALNSFFVISGFLVFLSYYNSDSTMQYFLKRAARIYPAYFSVIILCSFLGVFLTTAPTSEYFSLDLLKYVTANLLFMNFLAPELPGVFTHNSLQAVNGALWTIRTEVMCYCCVPIIGALLNKFNRTIVFSGLYLLAYGVFSGLLIVASRSDSRTLFNVAYLPWHFLCFLSGGILYSFFENYKKHPAAFFLLALVVYSGGALLDLSLLKPLSLAVIVVYLAYFAFYAGNFGKYGDLSYGVYIVHFPILQVLISYGLFTTHPLFSFTGATILIVIVSYCSWHIIEKPFLKRNSHYIIASKEK
ncbi:MAG: hypothetical protein A2X58_07245 [Nitrospirae bacterium GWC2_56_14]|nr:MAG: hypothetical protein A2X58_07245 [Nitrospirae bacterium GWC2_56_14]